jgi:isocitrate/isopropylmalate dehydrogenase
MTTNTKPVIGIIEGGGTGPELAEVFEKVVSTIYKKETGKDVEFLSFKKQFGYNPKTFWELKKDYYTKPYSFVKKICDRDVNNILKFDDILLSKKALGLFRTAINAETLYYLRRKAKTIKLVPLKMKKEDKEIDLLFIRDQIQGYYTTQKIKAKKRRLEITSIFSEDLFELILNFVREKAKELGFENSTILFLYKFHLMGIELQKMIDSAMKSSKLKNDYLIMQPDSGIHLLLHDIWKKDIKKIIVICGNEIGDMLLETLIHYYGLGTKETFFTSNFVLGKKGLEVLQTMHGSADDIAGKGIVNPIATLKLSAYALEKWLKVPNAIEKMEKIISKAIQTKNITPDMGGNKKTMEVVDYILSNW